MENFISLQIYLYTRTSKPLLVSSRDEMTVEDSNYEVVVRTRANCSEEDDRPQLKYTRRK